MTASEHGHTTVVGLLLSAGAKRATKDGANRTALKLAQAGQPAHALVTDLPRVTLPGHELTDANRPVDLPSASE